MGFRVVVVLCLSLALVANGQVLGDLAAKENQLNCLVRLLLASSFQLSFGTLNKSMSLSEIS